MSLMQTFIDLEQKLENALKEMRVGFPEGLKQQILSWGYDVSVWYSAHRMEVWSSLAVAFVLTSVLIFFLYWKENKNLLRLVRALSFEKDLAKADKDRYFVAYNSLRSRSNDLREELETEIDELKSIIELKCKVIEDLMENETFLQEQIADKDNEISDLQVDVSTLEDQLTEKDDQIDTLTDDVDEWRDKALSLEDDVSELEDQVESLTELSAKYSELVDTLDAANSDSFALAA